MGYSPPLEIPQSNSLKGQIPKVGSSARSWKEGYGLEGFEIWERIFKNGLKQGMEEAHLFW